MGLKSTTREHLFNNRVRRAGVDPRAGVERSVRLTGEYDAMGNQQLTPDDITFDSIYRFKRQEAPAVILVEMDLDPECLEQARSPCQNEALNRS